MKEKYLKPALVNAGTLEGEGLIPLAAVTSVKAVALLAGFAAGRAVTKVMDARPAFKLPSLTKFEGNADDFSMA